MCGFIFDPSKNGLRKTLKEYEELALRYIWETGDEGAGARALRCEVDAILLEAPEA